MNRAPSFWASDGLVPMALSPLGAVYAGLGWLRWRFATAETAGVPVLCIGNASVGGTGKTPIVLDVLARLKRRGIAVHALGRGHGGDEKGPLRVDPAKHDALAVGDEALLHAAIAPTWIARDRLEAARQAAADGAEAIVLDDGLQYPRLAKTEAWLVVDGATGWGNGRCVPAGPLREPVSRALRRSQRVVVVGEMERLDRIDAHDVLGCRLAPGPEAESLRGRRCLAFAGIGRPEKFFASLGAIGADVIDCVAFPDHHAFRPQEVDDLVRRAERQGLLLVTTTKDAVRLGPEWQERVQVLSAVVAWEQPEALERALDGFLSQA